MLILSNIFFIALSTILMVEESRRLKSLITPTTTMIFPFVIIDLFLLLFGNYFGYFGISIRVHLFLVANFIIFWIAGKIISWSNKSSLLSQETINKNIFDSIVIDKWLLWVSIPIFMIGIRSVLQILSAKGWWFVGTEDFEKSVASGLFAHLVQLSKVIFIFIALKFFLNPRKKIVIFVILTMIAIMIILSKVKYHIIWTVMIPFFMLNFRKRTSDQLNILLKLSVMVILLFAINYIIMFVALTSFNITNENVWKFIYKNFFDYFVSGPIMLDKWMDLPGTKPFSGLFIVFKNFYNVFWGTGQIENAIKYVSPGFMSVGKYSSSNVGTSFGVYYLIGGTSFTLLVSFLLGLLYHKIYILSSTKTNLIYNYFNAICLTMSTLSFFGIYFTLLSPYEMIVIFIILYAINKLVWIGRNAD